jgi:hypothetical protein
MKHKPPRHRFETFEGKNIKWAHPRFEISERLCISGGIPVQTGSKVPNKSPNLDQHADVHTKTATDQPSEVADVSIVNAT